LLGSERRLHEATVRALARLGSTEAARNRLIDFARDTRQQVAPARVAAIRALGTVVDKSVAQTLLDLLADEQLPVQNAAADALSEMSGIAGNGSNLQQWRLWFAANSNKSPAEWRAAVYPGRVRRTRFDPD
jgi:HEAT repeat protein